MDIREIEQFQKKIFDRYDLNKRDLPWRDTFDPYQVLVSETMLQQTQVDRVIPKFLTWMETLPTLEDLANTDKKTLLTLWSGLWFNSRVMRLQEAGSMIVERYSESVANPPAFGIPPYQGGLSVGFPCTRQDLLELPGVGPYTSAAILAFSYNIEVPVVDTNIRRVLIREVWLEESISAKELEEIALRCVPIWRSNDRHNALMDYGALVATAKVTGIKPLSKQSKFKWSDREVRGWIMKQLVWWANVDVSRLKKHFPEKDVDTIVIWLARDGMVRFDWDLLSI